MSHKLNIGEWITVVILGVVLLAVMAGVYPSLTQQASAFKNATGGNAMAGVLVTVLPILVISGILLVFVFAYLPKYGGHKR